MYPVPQNSSIIRHSKNMNQKVDKNRRIIIKSHQPTYTTSNNNKDNDKKERDEGRTQTETRRKPKEKIEMCSRSLRRLEQFAH